jgi:hypothetical protein
MKLALHLMDTAPGHRRFGRRPRLCQAEAGRFLIIPTRDEPMRWRMKRWFPALYYRMLKRKFAAVAAPADRAGARAAFAIVLVPSRTGMDRHERAHQAAGLLREAVDKGDFEVSSSPSSPPSTATRFRSRRCCRWRHPERGLVAPAVFLALCEDSGLILPLGRWVLERVAGYHKRLGEAGWPGVSVSVNVSPSQFRDPARHRLLREVVGKTHCPGERSNWSCRRR